MNDFQKEHRNKETSARTTHNDHLFTRLHLPCKQSTSLTTQASQQKYKGSAHVSIISKQCVVKRNPMINSIIMTTQLTTIMRDIENHNLVHSTRIKPCRAAFQRQSVVQISIRRKTRISMWTSNSTSIAKDIALDHKVSLSTILKLINHQKTKTFLLRPRKNLV